MLECCYHYSERACGNPYESDNCIEIPYFGNGQVATEVPDGPVTGAFAGCDEAVGAALTPNTQAERAKLVTGVWLRCKGEDSWLQSKGLVIRGDGSFHQLDVDPTGRLVETKGCYKAGIWGFSSNPNQLNFYDDGGLVAYFPKISTGTKRHLALEGMSGRVAFVGLD
jgi:hypothetical protein